MTASMSIAMIFLIYTASIEGIYVLGIKLPLTSEVHRCFVASINEKECSSIKKKIMLRFNADYLYLLCHFGIKNERLANAECLFTHIAYDLLLFGPNVASKHRFFTSYLRYLPVGSKLCQFLASPIK